MTDLSIATETVKKIQLAMMLATGEHRRGQHPKMHGCVEAEFVVSDALPDHLKVGIFARPGRYRTLLRYSNGGEADDRTMDLHGLAIKLFGVPGEKLLPGDEASTELDFILADNPVFFIRDAADYVIFMSDFAKSAPHQQPPMVFLKHLQNTNPQDIAVVKEFRNRVLDNPLNGLFWGELPFAFGTDGRVCRYQVVPVQCPGGDGKAGDTPNYLRERLAASLSKAGAVLNFQVQIKHSVDHATLNNPTVEWPEEFETVAQIMIGKQDFDTPERNALGEGLVYTPWRVTAEHRPLGEVNEIRKLVYIASAELRHRKMAERSANDNKPAGV